MILSCFTMCPSFFHVLSFCLPMLEGRVFFFFSRRASYQYFTKQSWNRVLQTVSGVLLSSHKQEQTHTRTPDILQSTIRPNYFATAVQAKQLEGCSWQPGDSSYCQRLSFLLYCKCKPMKNQQLICACMLSLNLNVPQNFPFSRVSWIFWDRY